MKEGEGRKYGGSRGGGGERTRMREGGGWGRREGARGKRKGIACEYETELCLS